MARREIIILNDDLNPEIEKDVRTVKFGFEGISYEIDLGPDNLAELAEVLGPFLAAARKAGYVSPALRQDRGSKAQQKRENEEARTWLKEVGHYDVAERGRIPGKLLEAWLSKTVNPEWVKAQAVQEEAPVAEVPKPRAAKKAPAKKVAKKSAA